MLDPELEAALDRMYDEALDVHEELPLWDGPDAPWDGEMMWLDRRHQAILCPKPNSWSVIEIDSWVVFLGELSYDRSDFKGGREWHLWAYVLTSKGTGWTRAAFLERR
jgi:hypothetical protein